MKTTKKLIKISKSLGIIIDKFITDQLELKHGDLVEIDIKKSEEIK